jgi:hypothetical protein
MDNRGEIIMYRTEDGLTKIEAHLRDETVWLSLDQMAELFQRDKSTVSRHIKNIFGENELDRNSVVANFATTAADGDKPFSGMAAWRGTYLSESDAVTAKNYLSDDELDTLNRIVMRYLEFAELQAREHIPMHIWLRSQNKHGERKRLETMGNDARTKKELQAAYKERKIVGGVFAIKNTVSGKVLVESSADMQGSANRFEFMKKTGTCYNLKLQKDWIPDAPPFRFEALEELEKPPAQNDTEFKADLQALKELWLEKLADADLYN